MIDYKLTVFDPIPEAIAYNNGYYATKYNNSKITFKTATFGGRKREKNFKFI